MASKYFNNLTIGISTIVLGFIIPFISYIGWLLAPLLIIFGLISIFATKIKLSYKLGILGVTLLIVTLYLDKLGLIS